ncbi:Piso0_002116 [Millerozyma farinosa CBS 7064]|uniref:Piso0_002116 protein n=1 Tax=Pichia sorbitophila (strain ATCC MYA-4447 / BCRC 22081 / CBS 7064 / NBRC 10061 / NRRL Y-12695) TaxID=559304 RepID=G8YBR0_PICSO|nr:Piso0_002116 [Millerozyma farinosa CBS 7064]
MSEKSEDIESISSEAPQGLTTSDANVSGKIEENEKTTEKDTTQDGVQRISASHGVLLDDMRDNADENNVSKSHITSDKIESLSDSKDSETKHKGQQESLVSKQEMKESEQSDEMIKNASDASSQIDANDTDISERDKETSKGHDSNRKPSLKFPGKLEIPREKQPPTNVSSGGRSLDSFEDKPETRFDEIDDNGSVKSIKKDQTPGFVLPKNLSKEEQKSRQEQAGRFQETKDKDTGYHEEKQAGVDDSGVRKASAAPKLSLTEYLRKSSKAASSSNSTAESNSTKASFEDSKVKDSPNEGKVESTSSSSVLKDTSPEVKTSEERTSTKSSAKGNEETSVKSEHEESTSRDKKEEKPPTSGDNLVIKTVRPVEEQVPTSPLYDNIADSSYLSPVADQPMDNTFLDNIPGAQELQSQDPSRNTNGYGSSHEDNSEAETDIADSPPRINIPKRLIRKKEFDENRKALFANKKTHKEEDDKPKGSSEQKSRSSSINEKPYKIKRDSSGSSLLQRACKKGLLSDVKRYIERGASPNECDFCGFTCLHEAALEGHISIVKYLIEKGADVNKQAEEEGDLETPLIDAAENKHLEIVRILLENGADPRIYNINGFTALTKIFNEHQDEEGYEEIISLLEEYNAKFLGQVELKEEVKEDENNLRIPAPSPSKILEDPNDSYFSDLIKKKTNSAAIYKYAAEGIKEYTANYFIEGGRLDYKPDIFLLAARNGHLELVDIILGLSAGTFDINQENNCGLTALLACVGRGHHNVTDFLLSRGANPHKRRRPDGLNALQIAERAIRFDTNEVKLLQEYMEKTSSVENSTESEPESNDEAVHSIKKADSKTNLEHHPKKKQKTSATASNDEFEKKTKKASSVEREKLKEKEKEKEKESKSIKEPEKSSTVESVKDSDAKLKKQTSKVFAPEKSPSIGEESKMAKPTERSFSPVESKDSEVTSKAPERSPSQSPVPMTKEQEEMKAKTAEEARLWQEKVEAKKKARKSMFLKLEREKERKKKEEDARKLEEEKRKEEQKKIESQQLKKLREQKQEQLEAEKETLKRKLVIDSYPIGLKRIKLGKSMSDENTSKFSPLYQYEIDGRWYALDLHIALLTGLSLNLIHDNVSDKTAIKVVDSATKSKLWCLFYPMIGVDASNPNSRPESNYIDGAQKFGNLLLHFVPLADVESMTKHNSSAIFHEIWELDRTSKVDLQTLAPSSISRDEASSVKQDGKTSSTVHAKVNVQSKYVPPHFRYRKDILRVINNTSSPLW